MIRHHYINALYNSQSALERFPGQIYPPLRRIQLTFYKM